MNPPLPFVVVSLVVFVAACAAHPPEAQVIDARAASIPQREPAGETSSDTPFPAGPGVEFMKDDLEEAAALSDYRQGYADRLEQVRKRLGVDGEEIAGGAAFRGIGARSATGPLDCWELAVLRHDAYARVVRVDRRLCGLPYGEAMKTPASTLRRVERVIADMDKGPADEGEGMARVRLGEPDDPKGMHWWAIGPRDTRAPLSCHALSFVQGRPHIDKKPLSVCGVDWPPPAKAFTRDETIVSRRASEAADACLAKCTANTACIVRRITTRVAGRIVERGDDVLALEPDGRPARIDVTTECVPFPSWCFAAPTRACVPSCVTPTEDSPSSHFGRAANGVWTLTCNMAKKKT